MKNRTALKALYLLSRPPSIGAILLLLVNDHLLRIYWPSWWTGKIGDFAWLYFTPFVIAALIAWLVPSRWKPHDVSVITLSIGVTGAVFTLGNTSPSLHLWMADHLEHLLGIPIGLRRDPSDLVALVSLLLCWWTWSKSNSSPPRYAFNGVLLIPIAAALTFANSAAPAPDNTGIDCLALLDNHVYAFTAESRFDEVDTFYSEDGGYTWEPSFGVDRIDCVPLENKEISHPSDPDMRFRYSTFPIIEISKDGGISWQEEFQIEPFGEIETIIYLNRHRGPFLFHLTPQDAMIEPQKDNVLFAMGYRGVLIREKDGGYLWSQVGPYRYEREPHPEMAGSLLEGQYALAFSFIMLALSTLSFRLHKKFLLLIPIGLFWAFWAYTVLTTTPSMVTPTGEGYGIPSFIYWALIGGAISISLLAGVWSLIFLILDHRRSLWHILIPAIVGGTIFIIPFYLWVYLIIPDFRTAAIIACSVPMLPLLIGDQIHRVFLKSKPESGKPLQDNIESVVE